MLKAKHLENHREILLIRVWHNPCGNADSGDIAVSPRRSDNPTEKGGDKP